MAATGGRALVTGATGFIGSHLAEVLLARGESVRALVRPGSPRQNVAPLAARGLELAEGDLLDEGSLDRALDGVERLYHVAGLVSTRRREGAQIHDKNFRATQNLWRAARRAKTPHIVYLGSIFALCGGSKQPLDEDAPYTLDHLEVPYFRAKREAELMTRREIEAGLPVIVAYPGYCLGPNDIYFSSMTVLDAFLRGQLVAYVEGGMSFLDVRDAALGLELAMQKGRIGRRYLLTGDNLTWGELFTRLARLTGRPAPRLRLPKPLASLAGRLLEAVWPEAPLDPARVEVMGNYYWYDAGRARRELGFATRPLDETLTDAIAWLRGFRHRVRHRG